MAIHLAREIVKLRKMILQQSTLVEQGMKQAFLAFNTHNKQSAKEVIQGDGEIDSNDVDLEEECLKILALHQPVAFDLRYVITCLKINNTLERIGDLAAGISEQALIVASKTKEPPQIDLSKLADLAQELIRLSLNSFMEMDITGSKNIITRDKESKSIYLGIFEQIKNCIKKTPEKTDYYIALLTIAMYMHRITDYAVNISEEIIYMITGEIVRHQKA